MTDNFQKHATHELGMCKETMKAKPAYPRVMGEP